MIETKVYLIKSDVKTTCHCGHVVHEDEEYYMLRTNVPKWMSLCVCCVKLLEIPKRVCMRELVDMYYETRPADGNGEDRKKRAEEREKRKIYLANKTRERLEKELRVAEWI